ncbi:MAG: FHA domain-containing protein [Myxococcales bacterium]|nr:FHA domain-containing protein [Myxococcales bacterium]
MPPYTRDARGTLEVEGLASAPSPALPRDITQRPCLVALTGAAAGRRFQLGEGKRVVGRGAHGVDISLPDADISRRHVEICKREDGSFDVTDLGSRNGTLLNDVPLVDTQPFVSGDTLQLGARTLLALTSRALIEEHLDEAKHMQSLGRVAGGVVHNLGNALSVLRSGLGELAEMLRQGSVRVAEARELLADMVDASDRASAMTGDLLRFTQRGPSTLERVDIGEVLYDNVPLIARMASSRADITASVEHEPNLVVRADRLQIEQLITSLTLNAVEAMSSGGELVARARRVKLSEPRSDGTRTVRTGSYVCIDVVDEGDGMGPDTASQAFEPFFSRRGRTGMGLALAYSTVRQHGGQVLLFTEPSGGTTVEVYLPPMSADTTAHDQGDVTTTSNNQAVQPRAFVISGEQSSEEVLEALRPLAVSGEVFSIADQAVLAYLENRQHVVAAIIDVGALGSRDGIRAYRRLRAIDPALRLIVIDAPDAARFPGLTEERQLSRPLERKRLARALYPR